tara:strand:- start:331 stop:1728 length:1398 start_codon:yes stop_codon:yes gene_type:complete
MKIYENPTLLLFTSILFLISTIYYFYQLKLKKNKGKTIDKELKDNILKLKNKEQEIEKLNLEKAHLIELENNEDQLKNSEIKLKKNISKIENTISKLNKEKEELINNLLDIKTDLSIYQPIYDLANVGFFEEPEYLFETSDRFKEEIKAIREEQKSLIRNNNAISFPISIAMTDNKVYVKRVLSGQAKLMLKAFNNECDNLMSLVKPSNYAKILERINRTATDLEKASVALKCRFEIEYIKLKFKECEFQYQYKLIKEEEQIEQNLIREQIREEQKAIKEYQRAIEKAENEEHIYRLALEKARLELTKANDSEKIELNTKISVLEMQLKEAEESGIRAKSMAEQTRKGHVYIISNIGSFGNNIYKIGLTRRLEPLDRVKELGSASVPFPFDVHAMIYSEDAPTLETQLHREFYIKRVNKINRRKEFFDVDLFEIKEKVIEITGNEQSFKMTALAENYYESLKLTS